MSGPFATGWVVWVGPTPLRTSRASGRRWALRDSDLPLANGRYYRIGPREYAVDELKQASVWRYHQAAVTYRDRFFPDGEVVRVEAAYTGQRTNDGRRHLLAIGVG